MSSDHDELHLLLGAYILGGLDDEDHAAFARHLRECRECQHQSGQLSAIPRLLDQATPDDGSPEPEAPLGGADLLLRRHERERRRGRLVLAVAAGVVGLALFGGGVLAGRSSARPDAPPRTMLVATPINGSTADVRLGMITRAWGTQFDVVGTSLPTSGTMALWVVDDLGRATQVATWSATASGQVTLTASCASGPQRVKAVQVKTGEGMVLAAATV